MRRLAWLIIGIGLALMVGPASAQQAPPVRARTARVEFLDVGQGDAILIRSPEGKTALVDAGPHKDVAAELLRCRGIKSLDLVVVSHHHADHYGGMEAVIREFQPRVFLASASSHTTTHYLRLLELVRDRGIQAIQPTERPRRIELGSVVLTVFPQASEDRTEENNNSIGIRLRHGSFSVLLTGDAEQAERRCWERTVPELIGGMRGPQAGPPRQPERDRCQVAGDGQARAGGRQRGRGERLRASQPPDARPAGTTGDSPPTHRSGRDRDDRERRRAVELHQPEARHAGTAHGQGTVKSQGPGRGETGRGSDQRQHGDLGRPGGPAGDRAGDRSSDHRGQALSIGR